MLALLKVGFDLADVLSMPESEALGYLEAYSQIVSGGKKEKKYVVKPGKRGKGKR